MRKICIIALLGIFTLNMSAQSVDSLKGKSKTTKKEKDDAARARSFSSTGYITPQHRRGVSWDVDDDTWGVGYSYSKHFPVALSANYTTSYFSIGAEIGANLDNKKIFRSEIETDDPIGYLSIAPGFYCKYFSINCGVGVLLAWNSESWTTTTEFVSGNDTNGNSSMAYSSYMSASGTNEKAKYGLLIKPSLVGYIPISDGDYYITLNVGYLYLPKFKDLNGFTAGIGFQITID